MQYKIKFEAINDQQEITRECTIYTGSIEKPTNQFDFSIEYGSQINILQSTLDAIIKEKTNLINDNCDECPKCADGSLKKRGKQKSKFYDVLSDHNIEINRYKCNKCSYEPPSTVRSFLNGTVISGDMARMQSEIGSDNSYRDTESIFERFSSKDRPINNHQRIRKCIEKVGTAYADIKAAQTKALQIKEAPELIINVDGGHVKDKNPENRSFEAMTSVVYNPSALKSNKKGTRNTLEKKSCAASTKDDKGEELIAATIVAALNEGLSPNTNVTALCDGAANCWNIVKGIEPLCKEMTSILDWFHITMKMQNISLSAQLKIKLMRIKWYLWRGNTENALLRLDQLQEQTKKETEKEKILKFRNYISNNIKKIANYRKRQKDGLVFTSNLAESTVESLINQRCKGHQHMRWTREGLALCYS